MRENKLGHLTFNTILSLKNTEISMLPYLLKLYSSVKALICTFEISLLQYQIPTIWTIYNLNYFKNNEGKKRVKRNECQRRWFESFEKILDRRELGLSSGGVKWREDGTCSLEGIGISVWQLKHLGSIELCTHQLLSMWGVNLLTELPLNFLHNSVGFRFHRWWRSSWTYLR